MIDSAPLSEHITFIGVRRLISILETMNCVDTFWPTSLYPYIIIGYHSSVLSQTFMIPETEITC